MGLSEALDATRVEEIRRAARALLRRPLLRAAGSDADAFILVRKHIGALRAWFDRNTGWRLVVDSEVARLVKVAAGTADHTYPARDVRTRLPFGRRRYVLTCLALAALDRAENQITLGRLAEQVVLSVLDPDLVEAGVVFTLDNREERGDLVAVVRLLLDLGVLSRVAGDEESFVKDSGDVLYDVERRVLATLLATPRGPSTIDEKDFEVRLSAVTRELEPTTDELRNRMLRQRLTRLLLETPVLYYDELDDAALAYLTSQRAAITARITELTGLIAEVRAEGIAMVDPHDDLTDIRMPDSGTDGHVTLLLAEFLAARDGEPVDEVDLRARVRSFADQHRSFWRRTATEPGAETELTALAVTRLEALRLIRCEGGTVAGRPALARYAVTEPVIHDPKGPDS